MSDYKTPCSPRDEIGGLVYFRRLCDKIRIHADGKLHPDYHANLGRAMDLWTCQLLRVEYNDFVKLIESGLDDDGIHNWCTTHGYNPSAEEIAWWNAYMRDRGFRDDLADKLVFRKEEAGIADRDDILTFFDFIDADEGRM